MVSTLFGLLTCCAQGRLVMVDFIQFPILHFCRYESLAGNSWQNSAKNLGLQDYLVVLRGLLVRGNGTLDLKMKLIRCLHTLNEMEIGALL